MQEEPLEDPVTPARGSFFGSVNIVMLTYVLDGALAFATGLLVARALGPEGRGAWGLFIVTVALAQVVLGLGAGNAAIYFLNRGELSLRHIVTALHSIVLFAATVSAVGTIAFALLVGGDIAGGVSPWWFALSVPLLLELALMRFVMQGLQRWVDLGVTTVGHQALILAVVAALYASDAATVERVIATWLAASVVASMFVLARIGVRQVQLARVVRPRFDVLRRLVGFGVQGEIGNVLQAMNYRFDQYIVRAVVGLSALGVYAVGVSLTEGVWLIANAVALVLMPRLTSDPEEAQWLAPLACRNTMLVAAFASLALAAVAPVIVPLAFGDAYEDAVQVLWWLLPGTVALTGSKVLTSYIFSRGKPLVNTGITAASLAVTVVADLALVPAFGINGAAAAASLAYATHLAVALYAYGRISGESRVDAVVPRRSDFDLYLNLARTTLGRITGRPRGVWRVTMDIEPVAPDKRLRIAVLADFDGPHARAWVRWAVARGHDVRAISYYAPRDPIDGATMHALLEGHGRAPADGSQPPPAERSSLASKLPRGLARLAHAMRYRRAGLARVVHQIAPDVLHAHFVVEHGFYAAMAGGFHPLVVTAWGSDVLVEPRRERASRSIAKWTLARADAITSNNAYMAERIVALGAKRERVHEIVLGAERYDLERHEASVNVRDIEPGRVPVVFSTRAHEPLYNIGEIIDAVAMLADRGRALRLVIAHEGSQTPALRARASASGAPVEFVGRLDRAAFRDALADAEVFVSVPSSDGTSVALLQAMGAGCFPIVSDLPTQREWVGEPNGLRVPLHDIPALAAAIEGALDDELRRRAAAANRVLVEARGLNETQMLRLEEIYERLAKRGAAAGI